jgi:dCTP deaminase
MQEEPRTLFPHLDEPDAPRRNSGVLPSQMIREAIARGWIQASAEIAATQLQPASLDLRLDRIAYRVRASFLSSKKNTVRNRIEELALYEVNLSQPAVLEKGCVYVVPLQESLNLPPNVAAKANPKSSTGRLDVFTRLITDYGSEFERVPPGYKGGLYTEIVPRTFSIRLAHGASINQLRFIRGNPFPSDEELADLEARETLVYLDDQVFGNASIRKKGLAVSINLSAAAGNRVIGYRAKRDAPLIDLGRKDHYDPSLFWEPLFASEGSNLVLSPEDFYILGSRECISVPPRFAAELVPYDPALGEFRMHYAGFLDPGFGYGEQQRGTALVLQVRSHEVPFMLEHGQTVGRLVFEGLLEEPEKVYGAGIGSSYQKQWLSLGKQFRAWA